ncbi:bifunctional oligoribonuclease/PAP phosphatase NrnA [Aceticella autotrophica]|uniref:Bifunctional oligoribonuclease/PAP phosphatase NrnA n=1 Tax=Aceticella autotrophica TaxID=2755338 RepID=A0A975GBK7_9THEO|nr:bifunctional oligoribonuclease/PAP phosphatase NrnA [Aceticella autotrophica]QSZ28257.1 bifunctional oligoribonuclease/PAP phosphatase NrnA [Aceticella autotrophica]
MILNEIIENILSASNIILVTHISPDGDAIGCTIAMYKALKLLKKDVKIFIDDDIPDVYKFLPNSDKIERPYDKNADIIVVIDCADKDRIGNAQELLKKDIISVNIDHHISNTLYADINYVDTNAASAAEIIYQIIKLLGINFDSDISTCLYTAIVTDTGGFMYNSTTAFTHEVAADLINNGAPVSYISDKIFHNITYNKIKLIGRALDSLKLYKNGKIACLEITKKDLDETNSKVSDIENIVNYGRDINGVEVAILLVEKDDEIKVSLRSKEKVDVNKIAQIFGGGGHIRASGCSLKNSLEEAKIQILNKIKDIINEG